MISDQAKMELDQIASSNGGLVTAETVLQVARDESSGLHGYFTWDNSEAAEKYRLQQARQVIRVYIKFEPRVQRETRALVSVPSDRTTTGGYRPLSDVLDNGHYRTQVVEEALKRIQNQRESYSYLPELVPLFNAIDKEIAVYRQAMVAKLSA